MTTATHKEAESPQNEATRRSYDQATRWYDL
jgi:hypothetical protein